jgi:hypothetical protein
MRWFLSDRLPDEKETEAPSGTGRVLSKRKTNYSAKDYCRFTYSNGVLVPEVASGGFVHSLRKRAVRKTVLDAVHFLNERRLWCSHATAARDRFLPKRMFEHSLAGSYDMRDIVDAMNSLIRDKLLVVDQLVDRNSARHPVYGLTVNTEATDESA